MKDLEVKISQEEGTVEDREDELKELLIILNKEICESKKLDEAHDNEYYFYYNYIKRIEGNRYDHNNFESEYADAKETFKQLLADLENLQVNKS